jgi:proline iminopeptidase
VTSAANPRDRLIAFRRQLGPIPRLTAQRVKVRGLELAVFSSPSVKATPPLLCINGGLLFDHTLLWPALAPLAKGRQLIFYDQRGRGGSEAPGDPLAARIEDDAADVVSLRVALGISRWDVLGHSFGAGIAILGTERDAEGTRRVALIDPVGATGAWRDSLIAAARERLSPGARAALDRFDRDTLSRPDPNTHSSFARTLFPAWFADPRMAEFIPLPRSTSDTGAAVHARLWRDGYDWTATLRAVETPSVVVHGERDLLPRSVAAEVASMLRRATLASIADAGHMPFLETPEPFFELLREFLEPP